MNLDLTNIENWGKNLFILTIQVKTWGLCPHDQHCMAYRDEERGKPVSTYDREQKYLLDLRKLWFYRRLENGAVFRGEVTYICKQDQVKPGTLSGSS